MSRRRLFGSMLSLVFLVNLARIVFAPLLEPLMATFSVGPGVAGFVATLAWLGSALPRIPTGYLLTRVPRHHVILASGLVLAVASFGAAFAPSIALVGLGAFLMGIASGSYFIAANPLVSELFPERVGRAVGIHGTGAQLAAVSAAPFVGVVLLFDGYRLAFLAISAAALLSTLALVVTARRADLPDAGGEDRDYLGALRAQWPLVLTGIAILGTAGFVWNGFFNFYVTYLKVEQAIPEAMARNLLTVVFAAGVPAFFVTGRLADRFPHVPLMIVILSGFSVLLFATTLVSGLAALVVLSAALGYVVHSLFPALDTYLLSSLPDRNRASAYSVYSGAMMVIQASGSSVVGALTASGLTFGAVFAGLAVAIAVLVGGLSVAFALGWLPVGGRPVPS